MAALASNTSMREAETGISLQLAGQSAQLLGEFRPVKDPVLERQIIPEDKTQGFPLSSMHTYKYKHAYPQ